MEMTRKRIPVYGIIVIGLLLASQAVAGITGETDFVSGEVVGGYRIVPVEKTKASLSIKVYRGDYVKFKFDESITDPVLSIPALSIKEHLSASIAEAPYVKMKSVGTYAFSLGDVAGRITVIEYRRPNYKEVTAEEAAALIRNIRPLILDVRTPDEFKSGHLADATLIPVQELQARYKEIAAHKNEDILIYCATGNRSTVAAKILIDKGFKRIYNLRYGIADWGRKKHPIVR